MQQPTFDPTALVREIPEVFTPLGRFAVRETLASKTFSGLRTEGVVIVFVKYQGIVLTFIGGQLMTSKTLQEFQQEYDGASETMELEVGSGLIN